MNIARILYPVEVLGPGKRVGIWVCGCDRKCPGCSNPELWNQKPEYEISVDNILELINDISSKFQIDGFTISGGEPINQKKSLLELLEGIQVISQDILLYTGYTLSELREKDDSNINMILEKLSVLIDGKYIEDKNTNVLLRGSENQKIYILNPEFEKKYNEYFKVAHNQIQNFMTHDGVVSVGIHKTGFNNLTCEN